MGQKCALIIATAEYQDTGLARLTAPGLDAHDFAGALKAPHIGAFDSVQTLLNEAEPVARRAIARFFSDRKPDDLLLLYFSGHGVRDDHGQLYLAVSDTDRGLLSATAIPANFINEQMNASRSRRLVLILDCCNSGAFAQGSKSPVGGSMGIATAFAGTGYGRVVLTATDATQYAWEGDEARGEAANSVFTHFLVKGLETGRADANADGRITLDELYDYVYEQVVTQTPRQTPRKFAYNQQGELVIAHSPQPAAKPAELPAELRQALESPLSGVREGAVRELDSLLRGTQAGLSVAALEALERLAQDDSRRVSAAAAASVAAYVEAQRQAQAAAAAREQRQQAEQLQAAREQARQRAAEKTTLEKAAAAKAAEQRPMDEATRLAAVPSATDQQPADTTAQRQRATQFARQALPPAQASVDVNVASPWPSDALVRGRALAAKIRPAWAAALPWVSTGLIAIGWGWSAVAGDTLSDLITGTFDFDGVWDLANKAGLLVTYTLGGLALFVVLAGLRRALPAWRALLASVALSVLALVTLAVQWVLFSHFDLPGETAYIFLAFGLVPGLMLALAVLGWPSRATLAPTFILVTGWAAALLITGAVADSFDFKTFWFGALLGAIGGAVTLWQTDKKVVSG